MQRLRFPLAVLGTSVALVLLLALVGGYLVGTTLAAGPANWTHSGGFFNNGQNLPPELTGLRDIPAADRFAHFRGVQVALTDKDNHPLTLSVTPGTVTSVSGTSLTLQANDGSSHTYSLDNQTLIHGRSNASPATLAQGEQVVVATLNGSQTAFAVVEGGANGNGFGPHGPFGH